MGKKRSSNYNLFMVLPDPSINVQSSVTGNTGETLAEHKPINYH
jgi:hypothetical protein